MTRRKNPRKNRRRTTRSASKPVLPRIQAAIEPLLHPRATGRPWKYLPLVLALAFAARAVVALSGDFVLHPDEIMQYLEPAHRLVFGSGITYWEYFYGARSWLVPGTVAGLLVLFDAVGLGQPSWYVGGVKLLFCAVSLAIPAGMYVFARRHFGETAGRVALLAGILNGLPYQDRVYKAWSRETGAVRFVGNQEPISSAYGYLARAPGVSGAWQVARPYFNFPGYYYLHRKIPFYDKYTLRGLKGNVEAASSLVSRIVSVDSGFPISGYYLERQFCIVRILRRDQNEPPVRPWIDHAPVILSNPSQRIMR